MARVTRIILVLLAFSRLAVAEPAIKSSQFLPAPPDTPRGGQRLEVVVGNGSAGLRAHDFSVKLEESEAVSIEAVRATSFRDSTEDLSVVILVQGNVLFMGDPESQPEPTIGYYDVVKEAINAIARARPQHTRMGLYVYGDTAIEKVPMGPPDNVTGEALGAQRDYADITTKSLQRGLERALTILTNEKGRRVLFVIGDGSDQVDYNPHRDVDKLEAASVEVYVLGASPRQPVSAEKRRLEALGRLGAHLYANQREQVVEVAGALATEMNNLYTVEFPAQASDGQFLPLDGKEHAFKVTAGRKDTDEVTMRFPIGPCALGPGLRTCTCADGTVGPPCKDPWPPWLKWLLVGLGAAVAAGAVVYWKTRPETSTAIDEPEPEPDAPAPVPPSPSPQPAGRETIIHDPAGSDDGWPTVGWIVPVNGPAAFQTFRLDRRTVIGAAGDCQVRVEDPFMSGHHAEILLVAGTYVLVDAGAANGVVFSNKRVDRHPLIDNDTFTCGRTDFKFKTILD
jgi:hypothetical protein